MGKGGQTIGFHYLMTVYSGVSRGPINGFVEARVGDKQAWKGDVSDTTPQTINKPDLFGGDQREGGIQGGFILLQGDDAQVLPGDVTVNGIGTKGPVLSTVIKSLKNLINQPMGEMRGFASILFDGLVTSLSPYPKEWTYRIWRTDAGWAQGAAWYPEKATISLLGDGAYEDTSIQYRTAIQAMNPAHIIYQSMTDPDWGAGEQDSALDSNSFIAAANQLCDEDFGLCLNWTRQEDVDSLIQIVIDHIGGVMYNDRETGKFTLRLIRDDYDPETIPHYTFSSGLLSVEDDDSAAASEAINEIIAKGHDPVSNEPFEVRVQNISAIQASGQINSQSVEYKGVPTRELLIRLAQRDLRIYATGLKRLQLKFDRRAWQLAPGMVVKISAPTHGIDEMVVRIGEVDVGSLTKGQIVVKAIEDIFGLPDTSFAVATVSGWTPPVRQAAPAAAVQLIESGFRDIYLRVGETGLAEIEDTSAYIGQLAATPDGAITGYDLLSKTSTDPGYTTDSGKNFTGTALLTADVDESDTVFSISDEVDFDAEAEGDGILIGDEIVELVTYSAGSITVRRGCADTIPEPHFVHDRLWTIDDDLASDSLEYATGEIISTKVLTRTSSDLLDELEAIEENVTLVSRHAMPFPPGNVQVDTESIFGLVGYHPLPVITWAHRDRLLQADQLIAHEDGDVGPEAGVTYRLQVFSVPGDVQLRDEVGIVGTSFDYDAIKQAADGVTGDYIRIVLNSQRDGFDSWKTYDFLIRIVPSGYGLNYGGDYGSTG